MKKRIVHIITSLGQGGAEQQLRYVANGLSANGHNVTVISLRNNWKATDLNCEVVYLDFNKGYSFIPQLYKLIKLLSSLKPDVLQTWLYHADLVGLIAGKLAGCKRILWNIRCSNMNLSQYSPATKIVVSILAKLSPYVNDIVSNSQAGIEFHQSIGYKNVNWHLIPNGFDTTRHCEPFPSRHCERSVAIHVDGEQPALTFGMIARVDPMKDYQTFINAAKVIHKTYPNTQFLCIGTGTEKFTDNSHNIIGMGSQNNIAEIYQKLDVFVLVSLSEGFPNVVGEAMSCGLPCIATNVGDTKTLVGKNGIIINISEKELIDAMKKYITMSSNERHEIGAAARQSIISNYNLEKLIERYDNLYSGI